MRSIILFDDRWRQAIFALIAFSLLVRCCISLHSYSGMNTPPMYGDYEAQRHWMEVTINLPATQWYIHSPKNNLSYWGLDYPPLSGYQSWLCGKFLQYFDPSAVQLISSHGYESLYSKFLMRTTVLISDILCYIPACFAAMLFYRHKQFKDTTIQQWSVLTALLLHPALLIIDHGHFQYNGISLGLAAAGAGIIVHGNVWTGSILFCASLNHKQMSLYFAPAFFAYLFGICLHQKGIARKITLLASIGVVVIASFLFAWAPFMGSVDSALAVVKRIFPTQRGLFEDYVANFWCVSSLLIKWKRLVSAERMLSVCMLSTLCSFLPSVLLTIFKPTPRAFLLCLANSALSFFLFSYQVHEKSILLPLLPMAILFAEHSRLAVPVLLSSLLSMYPLLKKDGLSIAYAAVIMITIGVWILLNHALHTSDTSDNNNNNSDVGESSRAQQQEKNNNSGENIFSMLIDVPCSLLLCRKSPLFSLISLLSIHMITWIVPLPQKYPFLFDALMVSWSFLHFISMYLYFYREQWREYTKPSSTKQKKS